MAANFRKRKERSLTGENEQLRAELKAVKLALELSEAREKSRGEANTFERQLMEMDGLCLPPHLLDETNGENPLSSAEIREAVAENLFEDSYGEHMHDLGGANPGLLDELKATTFNNNDRIRAHQKGESAAKYAAKRGAVHAFILALLFRARNQYVLPFVLVTVSAMCYMASVPEDIYNMLTTLHVCYSRDAIESVLSLLSGNVMVYACRKDLWNQAI